MPVTTVCPTGARFDRLVVIREADSTYDCSGHRRRWIVVACDCGRESMVRLDQLQKGHTRSCGCLKTPKADVSIGDQFGRWVVLGEAPSQRKRKRRKLVRMMIVRCACGTERIVSLESLRSGHSLSCSCLHRETTQRVGQRNRTHGQSRIDCPEYRAWVALKARCSNAKLPGYHRYGGRGITVSPEWWNSYEAFLRDMGPRPSADHSIDRIDNDGPYTGPCAAYPAGNCRWATRSEQARNTSRSSRVPNESMNA